MEASPPATGVARAHRVLALLVLAGGVLQFLLAGYAAFGGSSYDLHSGVGMALVLVGLVVLVLAFAGRRQALAASGLLFGLLVLQNILGSAGDSAPALGALHPVNGLAILVAAMLAAAGRPIGRPH